MLQKDKKSLIIASIIFILVFSISTFIRKSIFDNNWKGFYYSDGCPECSNTTIISPEFHDKDSCVLWGEGIKKDAPNTMANYECGKDCKDVGGYNVCKEIYSWKNGELTIN